MKNNQSKKVAIFDIDSGSIAATCVSYQEGNTIPEKVYWTKRVTLDDHRSFDTFFSQSVKTLTSLGNELISKSLVGIDAVVLVCSVPWMSSQKRTVHYSRKKAFRFDVPLFNTLIKKELDEPLSKNIDYATFEDLHVVERKTLDVLLNGYSTDKPFSYRKPVNDVAVTSLIGVMSRVTHEAFVHAIERVFHRKPYIISNTSVLYHAITQLLPHQNEALVFDIGGTNTQVLVIRDDSLETIASFPKGEQHIIEHLSQTLDISISKAQSIISLYTQEKLHDEYKEGITKAVEAAFDVWCNEFYQLCEKISRRSLLPPAMIMSCSESISSFLRFSLLEQEELMTMMHTRSKPYLVDMERLLASHTQQETLDIISDPALIPSLHIIGTLINEQSLNYEE
jgi:hypothetical protein